MVLIKKSCYQRCKQCDQWDTFFTGRTTCLSARVQSAFPRWMNWMWHPRRKRKKKVWQKVKQREMRWKMRWQMSDERLDHIVLSRLPFLPPRSAPMKPGRIKDQSRLWSAFHWCLNVCRKWPIGNTFHPALILEISHRNCVMYACVCVRLMFVLSLQHTGGLQWNKESACHSNTWGLKTVKLMFWSSF